MVEVARSSRRAQGSVQETRRPKTPRTRCRRSQKGEEWGGVFCSPSGEFDTFWALTEHFLTWIIPYFCEQPGSSCYYSRSGSNRSPSTPHFNNLDTQSVFCTSSRQAIGHKVTSHAQSVHPIILSTLADISPSVGMCLYSTDWQWRLNGYVRVGGWDAPRIRPI